MYAPSEHNDRTSFLFGGRIPQHVKCPDIVERENSSNTAFVRHSRHSTQPLRWELSRSALRPWKGKSTIGGVLVCVATEAHSPSATSSPKQVPRNDAPAVPRRFVKRHDVPNRVPRLRGAHGTVTCQGTDAFDKYGGNDTALRYDPERRTLKFNQKTFCKKR